MKIKLTTQQSQKRISQLNSRLKLLAGDIHGKEGESRGHRTNEGALMGEGRKSFFRSTVNVDCGMVERGDGDNNIIKNQEYKHRDDENGIKMVKSNLVDYQLSPDKYLPSHDQHHHHQPPAIDTPIQPPFSPKFSTKPPSSPYFNPSSTLYPIQSPRTNPQKAKKQLQQIINTKKQFHSLIKKELSELEKLEQMIVEQPEGWIGYEQNEQIKGKQNNRKNNLDFCVRENPDVIKTNYGYNESQNHFMKAKTEESVEVEEQASHFAGSNQTIQKGYEKNRQSPAHSMQSSRQSHYPPSQASQGSERHESSQLTNQHISFIPKSQPQQPQPSSLLSSPDHPSPHSHSHAQHLLHEFMVIDYSDQNIQSILRLVEEESLRRSSFVNSSQTKSCKGDDSSGNILSNNNSSISVKGNKSRANCVDRVREEDEDEEERHYRLIHSYKLVTLVRRIKYFAVLKKKLATKMEKREEQNRAILFHDMKLQSKSFSSLLTYCKHSLQEQHLLYKIKTIYLQNMLKKSAISHMLYNTSYKTFKFLSTKLAYQQQLRTKFNALHLLLSSRQQSSRYEQLSRYSEQINKKSLFRVIKERYEKIRETYGKYRLLKNVRRHRGWIGVVRGLRWGWVKRKIGVGRGVGVGVDEGLDEGVEEGLVDREKEKDDKKMNREFEENRSIGRDLYGNESKQVGLDYKVVLGGQILVLDSNPSQFINQTILSTLKRYQPHDYITPQFTSPLILQIKKSTLHRYISQQNKKSFLREWHSQYNQLKGFHQIQEQIQAKSDSVVRRVIGRGRKREFLGKVRGVWEEGRVRRRVEYFWNMVVGEVPGQMLQRGENQPQSRGEKQPQVNPLTLRGYKHHFMKNLRANKVISQKEKLQTEVYYETIYLGNVVKKGFGKWRGYVGEVKKQRIEKEQQEQEQRRNKQKEQQQRELREQQQGRRVQQQQQRRRLKQQEERRQKQEIKKRQSEQQQQKRLQQQQQKMHHKQEQQKIQLQLVQHLQSLATQQQQLQHQRLQLSLQKQQQHQTSLQLYSQQQLLKQHQQTLLKQQQQMEEKYERLRVREEEMERARLKGEKGEREREGWQQQGQGQEQPQEQVQLNHQRDQAQLQPKPQEQTPHLQQPIIDHQNPTSNPNNQKRFIVQVPYQPSSSDPQQSNTTITSYPQPHILISLPQPLTQSQHSVNKHSDHKQKEPQQQQLHQINHPSQEQQPQSSQQEESQTESDRILNQYFNRNDNHSRGSGVVGQEAADNVHGNDGKDGLESEVEQDDSDNGRKYEEGKEEDEGDKGSDVDRRQREIAGYQQSNDGGDSHCQQDYELHQSHPSSPTHHHHHQSQPSSLEEPQLQPQHSQKHYQLQPSLQHQHYSSHQSQQQSEQSPQPTLPQDINLMMDWLGNKIGQNTNRNEEKEVEVVVRRQQFDEKGEGRQYEERYGLQSGQISKLRLMAVGGKSYKQDEQQSQSPFSLGQHQPYHQPQQQDNQSDQSSQPSQPSEQQQQQQLSSSQQQSQQQQQHQSPSHPSPLLTYAHHHHTLHIKRLIFTKVFQQRIHLQQQSQQLLLLEKVFSGWRSFWDKKKKVAMYMRIYEGIQERVNGGMRESEKKQGEGRRRDGGVSYSLGKSRRANENRTDNTHINGNKPRSSSIAKPSSTQSHHNNNNNKPSIPSTLEYYPHSKHSKELFQNLYQPQQDQ